MISGYEALDVWKLAHELALDLYRASERFPVREKYGLTQQLRRAALSIPTNIAEGNARQSPKEFLQFCSMSRGSVAEVRYLLRFVLDIGWMDVRLHQHFREGYDRVGRMLNSLMNYLRKHRRAPEMPHE